MSPSAERLLRPVFAFLTLCLAAFLLSPTVASVHQLVEDLEIQRDVPFHLWKWYDEPSPPPFPDCGGGPRQLYSEVTQWPAKIQKDAAFTLRGVVQSEPSREGVSNIDVDIFLNETKSEPGILLGQTKSDGGYFHLVTSIPFDLQASHYHIVVHAKQKRLGCQFYREHWSDPEVDVVSSTRIVWDEPDRLVAGRATSFSGTLVDAVGGPVRKAAVAIMVDGVTREVVTNEEGAFSVEHKPSAAGALELSAKFSGSEFYEASKNQTSFEVGKELFELDGEPLVAARSAPFVLSGRVFVADDAREDAITIDLDGVNASACEGCPANDTFEAPIGADGSFRLEIAFPADEAPGVYPVDFFGGGLEESYGSNVTLEVPTVLVVEAEGTGLFHRGFWVRANLTDEVGRPLVAREVALLTPDGWSSALTNETGGVAYSGRADACGVGRVEARYNGTENVRGASAEAPVSVCGFLAFIPPWLLAVPWWVWPLAAVTLVASWRACAAWRQRYAPVIVGGPSLTLSFTEPSDAAVGYAAIGETVVATAYLEEPLPDGHALRMGTHRAVAVVPIDAELRAHLRIEPDKLGGIGIRAEVVDPKGRVVSRRTLTLKVVRYAEEIERRYLALRAGKGASEAATPREFERWLHARSQDLDPAVVRRLVHVFEEADYSPRVAGRADFAAYLEAEQGMEVRAPDAAIA